MNKYDHFSKVYIHVIKNACGRKKSFNTKEEAYQKGQDSYECFWCHKYHRRSISRPKCKASGYFYAS